MNTIEIIRTEKKEEEKTFSIGQVFCYKGYEELYILSRISAYNIMMISLSDGNRFEDDALDVKDACSVTLDEMVKYTKKKDFFNLFTPVDVKITVTL